MNHGFIILLAILTTGLVLKNDSLSIAGAILILLKLLKMNTVLSKLETDGIKVGIIIVTLGLLAPLAQDKYSINDMVNSITSPLGVSAILGGAVIIFFTSQGYDLLTTDSSIVIPIIFGSIIGIIAFNGVPVGPLVASGITMVIYNIYNFIIKFIK